MARYPIVSIDYPAVKRMERSAAELVDKAREIFKSLNALRRQAAAIDKEEASLNDLVQELSDAAPPRSDLKTLDYDTSTLDLDALLYDPTDALSESIKKYEATLASLKPIVEQAEAWDKHFRKQWQFLFWKKFRKKISQAEADSSFLEAVTEMPAPDLDWVDKGEMLDLDLERAFESQQLFEVEEDDS